MYTQRSCTSIPTEPRLSAWSKVNYALMDMCCLEQIYTLLAPWIAALALPSMLTQGQAPTSSVFHVSWEFRTSVHVAYIYVTHVYVWQRCVSRYRQPLVFCEPNKGIRLLSAYFKGGVAKLHIHRRRADFMQLINCACTVKINTVAGKSILHAGKSNGSN